MSYPDITLIHDICEILGVSEHELLTASEDVEARSAEKLAAKYRRYARNFKLVQYILYGGAALVCLICDAADGGGFGWSLIVLASLLAAASLTLLPALVPERMGGVSAALGLMASVTLLFGVICAAGGYDWFAPAALGTLFGLWLLTGPYIVRRLPLPEALKGRKASLYFALSLILLLALFGVCCLREGGSWFLTAALGVLLGLAVVLLPFLMRQLPLPARACEAPRAGVAHDSDLAPRGADTPRPGRAISGRRPIRSCCSAWPGPGRCSPAYAMCPAAGGSRPPRAAP